jgi:hypothetical protein
MVGQEEGRKERKEGVPTLISADPEEFLNILLKHALRTDPFIHIKYVHWCYN